MAPYDSALRSRRGYMDTTFGQAFDIVMQWMQQVSRAMQKELYMLRRISISPDRGFRNPYSLPGGVMEDDPSIYNKSLHRQIQFMRVVVGGYGDYGFGIGMHGRGYYGPGYGLGNPPALLRD